MDIAHKEKHYYMFPCAKVLKYFLGELLTSSTINNQTQFEGLCNETSWRDANLNELKTEKNKKWRITEDKSSVSNL